jgi:hypothetical protein
MLRDRADLRFIFPIGVVTGRTYYSAITRRTYYSAYILLGPLKKFTTTMIIEGKPP